MTKSRFLEGLWIGAMMARSLRNTAFPLLFAYPEPTPRANTTNLSMLQRIRLVKNDWTLPLYLGAVVEKCSVRDGRWCVAVQGHRGDKCLDSKITEDWSWERYLREGAVGGFFNCSRKFCNSIITNHTDANCELKWFLTSTGAAYMRL